MTFRTALRGFWVGVLVACVLVFFASIAVAIMQLPWPVAARLALESVWVGGIALLVLRESVREE